MLRSISKRALFVITILIVLLLCFSLLVLVGILLARSCGFTIRSMTMEYIVGISPKEGETLKDVTVYLPFPIYKGKPALIIFNEIKKDYEEYDKRDFPGMTLKIEKTQYGPMLKAYIPRLEKGYGIGVRITKPISVFSRVSPIRDYVLEPQFEMGKPFEVADGMHIWKVRKGYSKIFLDYKEGTGIIFGQKFEVSSTTHYFISLYSGATKRYIVGLDELPKGEKTTAKISAEISKKGWIEVPIIEY